VSHAWTDIILSFPKFWSSSKDTPPNANPGRAPPASTPARLHTNEVNEVTPASMSVHSRPTSPPGRSIVEGLVLTACPLTLSIYIVLRPLTKAIRPVYCMSACNS